MTDFRLEIGELAVHGVDVVRPERLGPAVETALARLLRDRGLPADPGPLTAPVTIVVTQPVRAEVLADHLARAMYEGLAG
jgi:hypothetical protein